MASRIGEVCLSHGAVDVFIPASQRAKRNLLEFREKFYHVVRHFGLSDLADVVVPRSRIAEFVERAKGKASEYGIPLIAYGHAGDGNVHLHPMCYGAQQSEEKIKELMVKIYEVGVALGGTISGEHGLGYAKKGYLPMASDKSKIDLMKRLKRAFDPNNIMNPGKVLDLE
jgi:glycolate oxidase